MPDIAPVDPAHTVTREEKERAQSQHYHRGPKDKPCTICGRKKDAHRPDDNRAA